MIQYNKIDSVPIIINSIVGYRGAAFVHRIHFNGNQLAEKNE